MLLAILGPKPFWLLDEHGFTPIQTRSLKEKRASKKVKLNPVPEIKDGHDENDHVFSPGRNLKGVDQKPVHLLTLRILQSLKFLYLVLFNLGKCMVFYKVKMSFCFFYMGFQKQAFHKAGTSTSKL